MSQFSFTGVLKVGWQIWKQNVVDKEMSVSAAFKRSGEITKGVKWRLFGWAIIQAVLNALGVMLFGLGLLITAPVTMLAYAKIYRSLENGPSV